MRRVLLVEDDPVAAEVTKRFLHSNGFLVDIAGAFAEALDLAQVHSYDVRVVDLGLPDEWIASEFDTLARLHELGQPIVVTTGSGNMRLQSAVRKIGAAFVPKATTGDEFSGDLLLTEIWAMINGPYGNPDRDSEIAGYDTQHRIMAAAEPPAHPPLETATRFSLSLGQMCAMVGAIAFATAVVVKKAGDLEKSMSDMKVQSESNNKDANTRFASLEAAIKKGDDAAAIREQAAKKVDSWRFTVTTDLQSLGKSTSTPVLTKDTP